MTLSPTDIKLEHELSEPKRAEILGLLKTAYNAEIETVANYLANSINLDGMLAMEIKESLSADITEELGHAKQLAARIKVLGGKVPGSQALVMNQTTLQPPDDTLDLKSVILGVIDAETQAINTYQQLIEATGEDTDPVTQDLAITIKADEEEHRREFVGFLHEYEKLLEMMGR